MLTDKQYAAIGRLALAINDIEAVIDMYAAPIMGCREMDVAVLLTDESSLSRKLDSFKKLLQAILDSRPELMTPIGSLLAVIPKAKAVLQQRNEYVHAFVSMDFKINETRLRIHDKLIPCEEETVLEGARQALRVAHELFKECDSLIELLAEARREPDEVDL